MTTQNIYNKGEVTGVLKLGPDGTILAEEAAPVADTTTIHEIESTDDTTGPEGVVLLEPDGSFHVSTPMPPEEEAAQQQEPPPPPEPEIDIDAIKQEAYLQGVEDGKQEAIRGVTEELNLYKHNLQSLMQCIPEEIRNGVAQAEGQLVELTLAIARRLIDKESEENQEIVKGVLKAAMEQVRNQTVLAIHLSPRDVEEIMPQFPDGRVELIPDAAIQPGGCRIETDMGEMDATIDTQWDAVVNAIRAEKG
jgi:flagellar assembly protein FliH